MTDDKDDAAMPDPSSGDAPRSVDDVYADDSTEAKAERMRRRLDQIAAKSSRPARVEAELAELRVTVVRLSRVVTELALAVGRLTEERLGQPPADPDDPA